MLRPLSSSSSGVSGQSDPHPSPPQKRCKLTTDEKCVTAETSFVQMHSSVVDVEPEPQEVLLELGLLITEGRKPTSSSKGFEEGPHCLRHLQKGPRNHVCTVQNHLCTREESFRKHVEVLWRNNVPLCIEVLLCSECPCGREKAVSPEISPLADSAYTLLEQWSLISHSKRGGENGGGDDGGGGDCSDSAAGRGITNGKSILHAVRSFLHFSQLSAWLALSKGESPKNIMYRVTVPEENFVSKFIQSPENHEFPTVQFKNHVMKVCVKSLPRLGSVPTLSCSNLVCRPRSQSQLNKRSQSPPIGEIIRGGGSPRPYGPGAGRPSIPMVSSSSVRSAMGMYSGSGRSCGFRYTGMGMSGMIAAATPPIAGNNRVKQRQLRKEQRNERMLEYISSLQGSGSGSDSSTRGRGRGGRGSASASHSRISGGTNGDQSSDDPDSDSTVDQDADGVCGFASLSPGRKYSLDLSPPPSSPIGGSADADAEDVEDPEEGLPEGVTTTKQIMPSASSSSAISIPRSRPIPTLSEKIDFLKSLDTAASRLFHRKTGLPLTSSPAPLRKGQDRFDFDSSLVSGTRMTSRFRRGCHPPRFSEATRALLGPFEESVLNGRIEPVSTVQGFTAEIGASGSFCPSHVHLPVTVFFYTFCDNDKISTPYLAHVDLGEQGYCVPRKGTVQVTLFNPLRTVIKMFVVQFNLENMPNNSQTFLRQRTYFMPLGESDSHPSAQKWLRYLIHLRFASNATGQIFLHTDIRMVIFRKSDADTATGFDVQTPHELRSFIYAPHNPKFSPRFNQGKIIPPSTSAQRRDRERNHSSKDRKFIPKKIIFQDEDDDDLVDVDESSRGQGQLPPKQGSSTRIDADLDLDADVDGDEEDEYDQECHEQEYEYEFEPCKNHSEIEIIV